jgi:hypothetical protein
MSLTPVQAAANLLGIPLHLSKKTIPKWQVVLADPTTEVSSLLVRVITSTATRPAKAPHLGIKDDFIDRYHPKRNLYGNTSDIRISKSAGVSSLVHNAVIISTKGVHDLRYGKVLTVCSTRTM